MALLVHRPSKRGIWEYDADQNSFSSRHNHNLSRCQRVYFTDGGPARDGAPFGDNWWKRPFDLEKGFERGAAKNNAQIKKCQQWHDNHSSTFSKNNQKYIRNQREYFDAPKLPVTYNVSTYPDILPLPAVSDPSTLNSTFRTKYARNSHHGKRFMATMSPRSNNMTTSIQPKHVFTPENKIFSSTLRLKLPVCCRNLDCEAFRVLHHHTLNLCCYSPECARVHEFVVWAEKIVNQSKCTSAPLELPMKTPRAL